MLEAARLILRYVDGVTFEGFWENSEKRDAVSLRLTVIGESAHRISPETEAPRLRLTTARAHPHIGRLQPRPASSNNRCR
ncbi:MAG: DUF86 domain-containing protein [Opitutaceae bacterium]|nr:DUF86 domain-containing protein [Opitutaceae bacterium]